MNKYKWQLNFRREENKD